MHKKFKGRILGAPWGYNCEAAWLTVSLAESNTVNLRAYLRPRKTIAGTCPTTAGSCPTYSNRGESPKPMISLAFYLAEL